MFGLRSSNGGKNGLLRGRLWLLALGVCVFFCSPSSSWADPVDLGAAGGYAVLGLTNSTLNFSLVTVNGNVGVGPANVGPGPGPVGPGPGPVGPGPGPVGPGPGGNLHVFAPSVVNGNIFVDSTATYKNDNVSGSNIQGTVFTNQNLSSAVNAATILSSNSAALSPTQTFGNISSATTIAGNGGLNVIDVNGNINNSLTFKGTSSDTFIVNVTGNLTLTGSESILLNGVNPNQVLLNFIGPNNMVNTQVGGTVNGILLDLNGNMTLDGTVNGELIGKNITLMSGAVVNGKTTPVPAPSSLILLSIGGLASLGYWFSRRQTTAALA